MINILDAITEGKELHKRLEELRRELDEPACAAGWALIELAREEYEKVFPNQSAYSREHHDRWLFNTDIITLTDDFEVQFTEYGRCGDIDEALRYIRYESIYNEERRATFVNNLKLGWLNRIEDRKREQLEHKQEELKQLEARIAELREETK